ncbi:MAG: hypothetical protein JXR96_05480 [Deltaproteobacteria bacterium]|nr:hypothetical protein [Deltaproteobacteria bacterium]
MRGLCWVLGLALCAGACGEDEGGFIRDVRMQVDFSTTHRALMTAQTPAVYRIKLIRVTIKNTDSGEAFNLLSASSVDDSPVFSFHADEPNAVSLRDAGVEIPPAAYDQIELGIIWLDMDLPFLIGGQEEIRSLRIWLTEYEGRMRGDVTVDHDLLLYDNWVFGPGNLQSDPELRGLSRPTAYDLDHWPSGRSALEYGPFGDGAFWDSYTDLPFAWRTPIPEGVEESLMLTVRVASTWHFTDQDEDGDYDWPADYGNDWHMDFPPMEAAQE